MWNKCIFKAAAAGMVIAVTVSSAGCGKDEPAAAQKSDPTASALASAASFTPGPSSSPSSPSGSPDAAGQDKAAAVTNNVQQAGNEGKSNPQSSAKPKITFDPYSVDKPQLMGVAIGEAADKTIQLHGSPSSTYVMEDSEDPITVYEYDGFNVGYNAKKLVEFVEIVKADADPGLNGLRIGQTTADAVKALGKPDSSTDYVITYKTKETILKLDVDTKSKTIQSIKLFGRNE